MFNVQQTVQKPSEFTSGIGKGSAQRSGPAGKAASDVPSQGWLSSGTPLNRENSALSC